MSIETMKLALEALENYTNVVSSVNDPNSWTPEVKDEGKLAREAITALRQAIQESSENGLYREGYRNGYGFGEAAGLRQAIEQAQKQEPVAWHHAEDYKTYFTTIPSKDLIGNGYWTPLYTSPPQPKEPEQKPVAWMAESKSGNVRFTNLGGAADELEQYGWTLIPLYTAPPQRQPLTDEQISDLVQSTTGITMPFYKAFVRAIEAAHGIKGEA